MLSSGYASLQRPDFFLVILVLLGVFTLLSYWNKKRAAKRVHRILRETYSGGPYERVEVQAADFPHLDLRYYDEASGRMALAGFRWVTDYEVLTITRLHPNMRNFLRCFISDDGEVTGVVYHIKHRGWLRLLSLIRVIPANIRACEFDTEFEDGSFLNTNNLAGLNRMPVCPSIARNQYGQDATLEELLARHLEQVKAICAAKGTKPLLIRTRDELWASEDRGTKVKSDFMQARRFLTKQDFSVIAGHELTSEQDALVKEFEKIRDEKRD